MSNLGLYQTMTTMAKKMGGPVQLGAVVALGGYVVGKIVEVGGKHIVKSIENRIGNKYALSSDVYVVHTEGKSNEGLRFSINDRFRVLEIAGDTVLIEKLGEMKNPYCVSADLLRSISNFTYIEGEEA